MVTGGKMLLNWSVWPRVRAFQFFLTSQSADTLLNVFIAIAVDNLAQAQAMTAAELMAAAQCRQVRHSLLITSLPRYRFEVLRRTCLCVCLSARVAQRPHVRTSRNFCTCYLWPWLGHPLMTMQYVMYFRFCGCRHVFRRNGAQGRSDNQRDCFLVWWLRIGAADDVVLSSSPGGVAVPGNPVASLTSHVSCHPFPIIDILVELTDRITSVASSPFIPGLSVSCSPHLPRWSDRLHHSH